MAYNKIGVVNMGLMRIGQKPIASLTENSESAIRAGIVYDYIRDEVLEARDWKFAKYRAALTPSTTTPANNWDFAYPLPEGFLRLARPKKTRLKDDPPVYPTGYDYIIESLSDGTLCLLTDYDAVTAGSSLYVTFIKRITDEGKFTASFISAFGFRLGGELALSLTDKPVSMFDGMMKMYQDALLAADAVNEANDYMEDQLGSSSWKDAGR